MTRRQFIESNGATCRNWQWSWSFVNESEKFVIFGAWDKHTEGNRSEIFSESWEFNQQAKRKPGYAQSREHLRLIEERGYDLFTFPMIYSEANKSGEGNGPAKMEGFTPTLEKRSLIRVANSWFASDGVAIDKMAEELSDHETYVEGARKTVVVNAYERNRKAREACLQHHGFRCSVCGFLFGEMYGDLGERFIHVHHLKPVSGISSEYEIDPVTDLVPICPNCHAMIHITRPPLTIDQLRSKITRHG